MITLKNWLIVRVSRTSGRPSVSRFIWGIVEADPSGFYEIDEVCVTSGLESLDSGIAHTRQHDIFKLSGQGREIIIEPRLLPRIKDMKRDDWSTLIQSQMQ